MQSIFDNKSILVIGGTGTIGDGIVKKLLKEHNPHVVRIFSRDEYKQFVMQQELAAYTNVRYLLGDVRDKERLYRAMKGIDIVFDAAALKHVPACEYNPFEAVKTNVLGTQNVIETAIENGVERVIYTSSDKAVSPTNTMGATKLLAERLISAADYHKGGDRPIFCAVRFGNVMGSRGSVIPLFQQQIAQQRHITLTHTDMTRFMMSLSQAVDLTLKAASMAMGGEIFVLKMPTVLLSDLASVIIETESSKLAVPADDIKTEVTGLRPGEKMYEELMSEAEAERAWETEGMFIIPPVTHDNGTHYDGVVKVYSKDYSSENKKPLTKEELYRLLQQEELI
ncbi:polysaccharide biosynthesis protein [Mahella australiensis]|uniref:Polysaccharide biosynthesis protein CapD n=1 Tax=Mahella australiensis (strain DSM 15567 / CIP 107919 / 50-1 BON) TaxID=697281 RepID=F3ZZ00_MAHA5|nr:polysaccharide biosynthesis protein [Mahella australiensis]AEE96759.1 polysaccharide biosynthesis protein CapD [Mahella australiensis 50-1 BON]